MREQISSTKLECSHALVRTGSALVTKIPYARLESVNPLGNQRPWSDRSFEALDWYLQSGSSAFFRRR